MRYHIEGAQCAFDLCACINKLIQTNETAIEWQKRKRKMKNFVGISKPTIWVPTFSNNFNWLWVLLKPSKFLTKFFRPFQFFA